MRLRAILVASLFSFPMIDNPLVIAQDGWTLQQSGVNTTFNSACFLHYLGNTWGWAVGETGTIIHTMNQGQDWIVQQSGESIELHSVSFTNLGLGWSVGSLGSVYHANQFGTVWTQQNSQISGTLWSVHFIDLDDGWIVGDSGAVMRTRNGGASWTTENSGTTASLYDVYFTDSRKGWTVGEEGGIHFTTDGGVTWTSQTSGVSADLHSIFFADANVGWTVGKGNNGGNSGVILHTTDSGNSWNEQNNPVSGSSWLADVFFADPNNGWAVGGFGQPDIILHTTDGGIQWTQQTSPTEDWFNDVHFVDANVGWMVGSNGAVLHTTTGGTGFLPPPPTTLISPPDFSIVSTSPTLNWSPASGAYWYNLQVSRSPFFVTQVLNRAGIDTISFQLDSLTGAARHYWRVSVTDPDGTSGWSPARTFTTEGDPPGQIMLVSPPHGTVVTTDTLLLSWNGSSANIDFYGVELANDSLFMDPIIYFQTPDTSVLVRQFYSIETYWWRAQATNPIGTGPFGESWRFSMSPTDIDIEEQEPSQIIVQQNYPNPFNPTTTIRFSIPRSGEVSLKIFNLLGEEVATLVSGNRDAGTHTVEWDAAGQPSGVYFYRLRAGEFVETRKLVLVR